MAKKSLSETSGAVGQKGKKNDGMDFYSGNCAECNVLGVCLWAVE